MKPATVESPVTGSGEPGWWYQQATVVLHWFWFVVVLQA